MSFTYHGLFFGLAALTILMIYQRLAPSNRNSLLDIPLILLAGLIGARIVYVLLYLKPTNFLEYISFWRVGLVSFGGLAGGIIVATLLYRRRPELNQWWSALTISTLCGWAIGRIGS